MANKEPTSLIEHLIFAFCEALKADPDIFATGVRGIGDVNSRVKEGVVFVARQHGVGWADIAVGKGMPGANNMMTVFKRAQANYGRGKNEFGRMVDAVAKAIPEKFLPAEAPGESTDTPGKAAAEKNGPRKTRGPHKKHTPQGESPSRSDDRPPRPVRPVQASSDGDKDLIIFLSARCKGRTPIEVADLFGVNLAEVQRACGRFYLAELHNDPEVKQLLVLFEKVQSRSGS